MDRAKSHDAVVEGRPTTWLSGPVSDTATFADPHRYPRGIPWVLVNGRPVIDGGRRTGARPRPRPGALNWSPLAAIATDVGRREPDPQFGRRG